MKLNWNFRRGGGGGHRANPFRGGGVWIFSGTTHFQRGGVLGEIPSWNDTIQFFFKPPYFVCVFTILVLTGYGDKEVYAKLNPELEKRLPREYTEWRR